MVLLTSVVIFLLAFVVSRRVTPVILGHYARTGRVDRPGGRKRQEAPIPYGAGMAVLLGFAVPVTVGFLAGWLAWEDAPALLETHAAGIRAKAPTMAAILIAASCMLIMGRFDDRYELSAAKKFLIQVLAAALVVAGGVRITLFIASPPIEIAVSILWVVFITNAANFIDNMDGLLAGCSLNSCLSLGAIAALDGQLFVGAFALALAGALAGILPFNRVPARIYLGDEGSMFVGFLLACLTTLLTYAHTSSTFDIRPFMVPLLCLALPVADGIYVIIARTCRGKPPWTPGRDHISHRLLSRMAKPEKAVGWLWIVSLCASAAAILLQEQSLPALVIASFFVLFAIAVWQNEIRS